MDFYVTLCVVLCVASGSSPASLRPPRQIWPDPFMEHEHGHFHFPDQQERKDRNDINNDIFGFPDMVTRPGGAGNNGFGGQWPNKNNNRRPNGGVPDFSNNPWLNGINGQRPGGNNAQRPNNSNQQTPTSSTPSTTTDRTSTPRTFHLAPEGCDCPSTPQFNPVCGSDGNTYKNAGLLKCFRLCGIDVSQRRMGAC